LSGAVKVLVWPGLTGPVLKSFESALSVSVCVTESSFRTVTTAPGETVSEAGENAKFLMTIESLVTGFWPDDAPVAAALLAGADEVDEVDEGALELLELLEQAVNAAARTIPGTQSQLR
jgi:hypothetical protein